MLETLTNQIKRNKHSVSLIILCCILSYGGTSFMINTECIEAKDDNYGIFTFYLKHHPNKNRV